MKLLAVNTIGLTGAELIAAELARYQDVLMLPGQNFIGFGTRTYRPHDYTGWSASDTFASLNKHHVTRAGRVWAGLTKSMSPEMLERYDRERHEDEFARLATDHATTLDHFENFTTAYAVAGGLGASDHRQFGFFGFNIVLSAPHYPDFLGRSTVIDFTNPIDFWLANIGSRAVWDSLGAIRFWLTNMLVVRRWAARHPEHYVQVAVRDYLADPSGVREKLAARLGLGGPVTPDVPDGFVRLSPATYEQTERAASDVRAIYSGWAEFDLALTFDDWADDFLAQPATDELLDRFELFWNSTSHTNLDWPGPIADQLAAAAVAHSGRSSTPNLSRWFYHECFHLNSDDWRTPSGTLEHYLGSLEDEIVLPELAAHACIALLYLDRVAENITKRAYSALPIRETSMYQRVIAQRDNFAKWDMVGRLEEVERHIDEANAAMEKFSL